MIKRSCLPELIEHLDRKEISLLIGPRQAGKTTLMRLLGEHLKAQGRKIMFLDLDIEEERVYFNSQRNLLDKIKLTIGNDGVVFIDEIQRKEDAGRFLKGIHDMNLPYKFIVSGSGSMELKEKIGESLMGRKRIFKIETIRYKEFVNYKTDYLYENRLEDFFRVEKNETRRLLEEYLRFGGYPRVVLALTGREKYKEIREIYDSYLERDIIGLLRIAKSETYSQLIRIISAYGGQLINYSHLSSILATSQSTVREYLWFLEKTFILQKLTPFTRRVGREIIKSPIYYFKDLGLKNYGAGIFGQEISSLTLSFLFQNFVFLRLEEEIESEPSTIHFWRSKGGAEVDFVLDLGSEILPIEVKYSVLRRPEVTRSLRAFLEKYQPRRAVVVNLGLKEETMIGKTKVFFLPFYEPILK